MWVVRVASWSGVAARLLREVAWHGRLRGVTFLSLNGFGDSGFGRRRGGRAWQDS
jgi:hypothetical protein